MSSTAAPQSTQPIVERLRHSGADAFNKKYSLGLFKLHDEAADRIEELEAALREIKSWKDDTLGERPRAPSPYDCAPEINAAFDRGVRMAFYRCAARADAALPQSSTPARG